GDALSVTSCRSVPLRSWRLGGSAAHVGSGPGKEIGVERVAVRPLRVRGRAPGGITGVPASRIGYRLPFNRDMARWAKRSGRAGTVKNRWVWIALRAPG